MVGMSDNSSDCRVVENKIGSRGGSSVGAYTEKTSNESFSDGPG